eukprot:TRINITY_DN25618_c0_g1_i1.p1 TRINITY_DN25618_c0_g1~~TRINITY_DN25618_c0_g1_i1.p1  ORF type:complete len:205 (+),score=24.41 TRINITY_DN25618_c0_g1_i1:40-654(+)
MLRTVLRRGARWMSKEVADRLLESDRLSPCVVDSTCVYSGVFRGLMDQERREVLKQVLEGVEVEDGMEDPEGVTPRDLVELEWGGVPQIEPCHAQAIVDQGTGHILDVREDNELIAAPFPGTTPRYIHIPLSRIATGKDLTDLGLPPTLGTESDPCLVLCKAGVRSQRVAEHLVYLGRSHVANISGGIQHWNQWTAEGSGSKQV